MLMSFMMLSKTYDHLQSNKNLIQLSYSSNLIFFYIFISFWNKKVNDGLWDTIFCRQLKISGD